MTIAALMRGAAARLGGDTSRADAELLLAHALGCDRAWLFAHADEPCAPDAATRFESLVARRAAGEPVAYLTGRRGFWTLDLEVGPGVLVP
ncbi:MAG: protein-(glutamine-N5) methyltransferase, release factor-specific, partial [Pseudomonadota bacterium]